MSAGGFSLPSQSWRGTERALRGAHETLLLRLGRRPRPDELTVDLEVREETGGVRVEVQERGRTLVEGPGGALCQARQRPQRPEQALVAGEVSYVSGEPPAGPVRVRAKIRYKATQTRATWTPLPDRQVRVEFDNPLRDITPGQAVVAYDGRTVLGGGIIEKSNPRASEAAMRG